MGTLDPDRWQALDPYLDQALEFDDDHERARWLASVRAQSPPIADDLERLLARLLQLSNQQFLEHTVVPRPVQPATAGQTLGCYRLVSLIGQGGMGTVWLAERSDGRFDRRVAIKFVSVALGGRGEERFRREGRILGELAHPHIAQLLDAGISDYEQPFLVLEHVDGKAIDSYCREHGLSVEDGIRLFLEVVDAVSYAHAHLIVHRDIKPSNVLVDSTGHVKLLDFGIAKLLDDDRRAASTTQLTRDAALTPEFAAPEQITGGAITTATDVYALGVLLYLLLTGSHPAAEALDSPADLYRAVLDREPRRPSDVVSRSRRGALRGDLDTIVLKSLKKDPRERYSSVAALGSDLRRHLEHEPISARPDSIAYRGARFVRRNRMAVALSSLVAAAVIAGIAASLLQAQAVQRQRDFAYRQLARAERINQLNQFLLSDTAPDGHPLTINELLDRAVRIVEREDYSGDAATHVDLLISVGQQYGERREVERARGTLEKAYALSRTIQDPSVRARAACALALPLTVSFDLVRAGSLVGEGLRELPPDPQFALDRTFCLLTDAAVAMTTGEAQRAIRSVELADRALKDSPFQSEYLKLSILRTAGSANMMAARLRESITAFEQAAAQMTRLGYDDTRMAATLLHNWGLALSVAGRPGEAERIYRRALQVFTENQDSVPTALLNEYAGTLFELGRKKEALDYAERAYAKAKHTSDRQYLSSSLMARSGIYRDQGDFARTAALLDELEALIRAGLPAGHYGFGSLASARSLLARSEGDAARALRLANEAVALVEAAIKAGGQGAHLLPVLLIRRSAIELENHQPEAAVSDARRALTMLDVQGGSGEFSVNAGRAYLALGRALEAQGQMDAAQAAARSAAEHLDRALATDHPDARDARRLADAHR